MNRRARLAATTATVALVFAPVVTGTDSFPLSTYPMYARARAPVVSFVTAQGLDAAGNRHVLSLGTIGNSDDPLIVAGELRAAIRDEQADRRCREIAGRVDHGTRSGEGDGAGHEIIAVEIVTEGHDVIGHVDGSPSLTERVVHARCPTARPAP